MVTVIIFEKHTAADCAVGNEKARNYQMAVAKKLPELLKKYGIKMVGAWAVHNEHLILYVLDAPNFEAVDRLGMEPEMLAWRCFTTADIKTAIPMEEVNKRFEAMLPSK